MPRSLCLIALHFTFLVAVPAIGAPQSDGDIGLELTLVNGLHSGTPGPQTPNLIMDADRRNGVWDRIWANARNYNIAIHWGRVETNRVANDAIDLDLAMRIEGDSWVPGGRAFYQVRLSRDADGRLEGTYQARFRDKEYAGRAFGRVKPKIALRPGFVPFAPGEHPRMLFRKADIPRLRELLKTPFGKAVLDSLPTEAAENPDAMGLGVRYILTGDQAWAEKCKAAVTWHMNDVSVPAFARGRQWGRRLEQVAVGFDLCCDAWPQDFRKQVASYLRFTCSTVFSDPRRMGEAINWNVGSNYAGPIYAGVALSGLALLGEPGPEPTRPMPPCAVSVVDPAEGYSVPEGVPVVPLPLGGAARQWLTTSVGFGMSNDPMEGLPAFANLRPAPGTKVSIDETESVFAVLDACHVMTATNDPKRGGINLRSGHIAKGKTFTLLGYNVIKVDTPAQLKLRSPFSKAGRVQVVMNGQHVADGQVISVKPGLYPFLVCLRLPANLWGSLEPWFEPATPEDVAASETRLEVAKVDYVERLKDWEFDLARWKANGNCDVQFEKVNEMGRRMMYLFCREACGDGGYQTESGHYFEDGIDGPARYAHAYWTAYGRRLSTFDDITAFVPRKLMAKSFFEPKQVGKDGFVEQSISSAYSENSVLRTLAELYPQIDGHYRPALLWHWNREWGGDPQAPDLAKLVGRNPVYCLVNYPINASGSSSVDPVKHPREVMPLTWSADGFGYYIFRNGWLGSSNDIVVQVFGKAKGPLGWGGADGSTFRILGSGSVWAAGNTDREVRRWRENCVILPDDNLTDAACGKIKHRDLRPDGSGTVTIDVSLQFYAQDKKGDAETGPRGEHYGGYYHPGTKQPVAKEPIRAFAVDYSKASGAPLLFSVLDRIDGGGRKDWYWQIESSRVTVDGNRFVIKGADGYSMQVTFVTPTDVVIDASAESRKTTKSAGNSAGSEIAMVVDAVRANGKDVKDGRFWAVATMAKGPHPEVKVSGSGLDARVTVGGQTLTFDGKKLILSK